MQQPLIENMTDEKQLKNVEYFIYLCSMITNDARYTREIKCRITMETAAFNKKNPFTALKLKKNPETSKPLNLEHSFVWC